MSFISQRLKQRLTFRELLAQKIKTLRQIETDKQSELNYVESQFIVHQKSIKQSVIYYVLNQRYQNQFDSILQNWKVSVNDDKFIEDVFFIKKKMVEQQWIGERMKSQQILEREQKVRQFLASSQQQQSINHRLKNLKDELSIAENKINMAKNQDQSVILVKQYKQLKQQQIFLKNKKRRLKSLDQQKSAQSVSKQNVHLVSSIQDRVRQLLQENIQKKFIKASRYTGTEKTNNSNQEVINQESKTKILKLEKIFTFFAKKQCKESMLFEEMQTAQNYVSLQNFLKLISQTSIDSLLTLQQRVNVFKGNASFQKKIDFPKFINALIQIARKTSEKLKVRFDSLFVTNFLSQFLKKAKQIYHNKKETDGMQEKKNTNYLRKKELSSYKFKLRCHTGKLLNNISEELIDRQKAKYEKFKKLRGQSTNNSYMAKKESVKTTLSPISEQREAEVVPKLSLKIFNPTQSRFVSQINNHKNTYLNIFRRKKKSEDSQKDNYTSLRPDAISLEPTEETSEDNNYHLQMKKSKAIQELQRYVEIEEDDTFLTSHLLRIPVHLEGLKLDKKQQKIHY